MSLTQARGLAHAASGVCAGHSRLVCRPTTLQLALSLTEALDPRRISLVAGRTGARTADVATRLCRAPHHTILDAGLIGGARCRCRATCRGRMTEYSFWMNCRSSAAMYSRCCAHRLRMTSQEYHLLHVIDLLHEPRSRAVGRPRLSHTSMRSRGLLSRRGFWDTITVRKLDRRISLLGSQTSSAFSPRCWSAPRGF